MNKAISINIGNLFFHIKDDAYRLLEKYLKAIKRKYAREEGGNEIIEDVEARVAEMLQDKLTETNRQLVEKGDIEEIIKVIGKPDEFEEEGAGIGLSYQKSTAYSEGKDAQEWNGMNEMYPAVKPRLYRHEEDKVIAGVASGLATYFNVNDPLWIRLLFALSMLAGFGTGLVIYIALWIALPVARTPEQKIAMRKPEKYKF